MVEFFRFMIRFFQGWRRKIGVVTLIMACALMGLWLRSQSVFDHVYIPLGNHKCDFLASCEGKLSWGRRTNVESYEMPPRPGWTRILIDVTGEPVNETADDRLRWHWKWFGFGVYDWADEPVRVSEIPHWSVVLPLTVLSVYLLLINPRPSNQKKTDTPVSGEGL